MGDCWVSVCVCVCVSCCGGGMGDCWVCVWVGVWVGVGGCVKQNNGIRPEACLKKRAVFAKHVLVEPV